MSERVSGGWPSPSLEADPLSSVYLLWLVFNSCRSLAVNAFRLTSATYWNGVTYGGPLGCRFLSKCKCPACSIMTAYLSSTPFGFDFAIWSSWEGFAGTYLLLVCEAKSEVSNKACL